jgi:serine/threonine protein phosphatase PrpC
MYKTKELKNFIYFGESHKGLVRDVNEDAFAFFESINGSFFILCDGMGGIKGGKKAAQITISEIGKTINESWERDIPKLLRTIFENANAAVIKYFSTRKYRPGTTLLVVLIRNNKVWYAHVGDSRIYYQTGRKLFQITKDHSYVQELIDKKEITGEEAQNHPRRNEITNAIGIHPYIEPDICKEPLNPNDDDYILLCSDGLTNELSDKDILEILKNNKNDKAKADQLISLTLEKGAYDNVTVQLIRFYNTGNISSSEFKRKPDKKRRKKLIRISVGILLLIVISLSIRITRERIIHNKIERTAPERRYSSLFMNKSTNKVLFLEKRVANDDQLNAILKRFELSRSQIEEKSEKSDQPGTKNVFIPVKNIYFHRPGKQVYSYPGIGKHNMIDILRVNEKSELYFKPGEIIIVPLEKEKNGR